MVQHLLLNSLEWYITYMAVLKTGAVVSPLNFRFASNDIKYACDVTKSKVFILGETFVPRVEPIMKEMEYCGHYVCVGSHVACDHETIQGDYRERPDIARPRGYGR